MGFLRKVGRKIKKGVKKLFGGKFGKILGGIGLAMMFWGGANALFGNQKWFQGLKTNLNKVNPFAKGDVTGAVESVVNPTSVTSTGPSVGTNEFLEGAKASAKMGFDTSKDAFKMSSDFLTETSFADLDTLGQKIKKVGVETKDFLTPDIESARGFAGDVTKSVVGAVAVDRVMGEEEQTAGFGRMPSVGSMEAPQSAYLAEVRTQMPNLQATNFNQLNQSLFYGTLSPQYLMGQMG